MRRKPALETNEQQADRAQRAPQKKTPGRSVTALSRIAAVAAAIAIVAVVFGAYGMLKASASEAALEEETVTVLVTATEIPAGKVIDYGDVTSAAVQRTAVPAGAVTSTDEVIGKTAIAPIAKNSTLTGTMLTGAGSETLAAVVEPAHVAITISVNQQSGLAGLIHQGDSVDVYSTANGDAGTAKLIAGNCSVLALNSSLAAYTSEYTAVTLQVSETEAAEVASASTGGHIALVMRSAAGNQGGGF